MKRKNDLFSQAIVGLFMIVILLLLGYFTIVVSGVDLLSGTERMRLRIEFGQVGGLKDHDSVMYRGTKVGMIDRVEVTPSNLVVVADVDSGIVIRSRYRISVCNLSMLGGNYLHIEEGTGDPIDAVSSRLVGEDPTDWMRDVSRIAQNLNELTSRRELHTIVTNFEAVSERCNVFMVKANAIADKVDSVVGRIERGEGMVGRLINRDDALYDDIRSTAANAREISEKLNRDKIYTDLEESLVAFRKAAESFNGREVTAKADRLLADFDEKGCRLLDNLNAVALNLKEGNGTLGKLNNDPGLYNDLQGLIRDVRQVLDNFRDTTPISTFSSLAIGGF